MKQQRRILIASLSLIVFGLVTYWLSSHYRIVWEEEYIGFQGEASYNRLLAAQRLLERLDLSADTVYFLLEEDELYSADTIVLRLKKAKLNPLQSAQIMKWVEYYGGHLIVEAVEDNEWLDLGIKRTSQKEEKETAFKWQGQTLEIDFTGYYYLETTVEPIESIAGQSGYYLLHYDYGEGLVTVLSDLDFINNRYIGDNDHAQFFWQLLQLNPATLNTIWLIDLHGSNASSLWPLLWQHAWTLIISIAVLLVIWLWHISRRFGPLLPVPAQSRRRLLEHIEASGRFLWQQQQTEALLHETRQAVFQSLQQVYPNWLQLPRHELVAHLAELSQFSPAEVQMALYHNPIKNTAYFTRAIQVLNAIKTTNNQHYVRR